MHRAVSKKSLWVAVPLLLLGTLGVAGGSITQQSNSTPQLAQKLADRDAYSPNGGAPTTGGTPQRESDLGEWDKYWTARTTYPTGYIKSEWLQNAVRQDGLISSGIPAGQVTYSKATTAKDSPLALDPNSFISLGPKPVQSDGCLGCYNYGHVSGRVDDAVIDPVNPNVAYIAVAGGGVWKTTNCCTAATTWTVKTDSPIIATSSVGALTIDPSNHNTIYAGTGELNFNAPSYGSQGIYKSTDAGETWTVVGSTVFTPAITQPPTNAYRTQAIGKVKVDPRNSSNVVAGTKTGLFFSYDAGATWSGPCTTNSFATQRQETTGLILRNDGSTTTVYAAVGDPSGTINGANGVYTATMGLSGCPAAWNLLNNGWPAGTGNGTPSTSKPGRIDLAIAPSNPNVIYAQAQNAANNAQLGVWRSINGGSTWTQQSTASALGGCGFDYNQNWYDQGLAVDPNNPDVLFMDTYDVWKSTDGGVTFTDVTCGYGGGTTVHVDQHALYFQPGSSSVLLAGSDGGIYATLNATATLPVFTQMNDTLNTIEFYTGDLTGNFATSANPGANGGAQDNGSSVNMWSSGAALGEALWQLRVGGDGFYARIEPVLNRVWYQGNNSGHIHRFNDGPYGPENDVTGAWTGDTRAFAMPYEIYKNDCPPTGCTHLIVGTNRVWETVNGAVTSAGWYTNSLNLTKGASYINQLAYAPSLSTTAMVGTNDGNVQYGFNLGQGTAGSATWVNVTGGNTVLPNRPILDVTIHPTNPLVGYAAIGTFNGNTPSQPGHVYEITCTANCATFNWVDKTGNLPDIPADSIMVNPKYPQQVFVGTDFALYYTNDITVASPVWMRFDAGIPHAMIWDLTVDRGNTTLAAWTRSRGAYVWPLPNAPFVIPSATVTATGTPPTPRPTATATATGTAGPCYTYLISTATAVPIIPGTNDIGNHCDDCLTTIQMPFPVTMYDQTFSQGYASSDGSFMFGPAAVSISTECLPDRNQQYAIIAYQADLCTGPCSNTCATCGIYTTTLGLSGSRQFVVEYRTAHFGVNDAQNFEIIFNENPAQPPFSVVYGVTTDNGSGEISGVQQNTAHYTQYTCNTGDLAAGLQVNYWPSSCVLATASATVTATVTATATACPTYNFSDVSPSDYFYTPVQYLACHGVINGYADGSFRPYNNTTRGQMSKIVALGYALPIQTPAAGARSYEDVLPTDTFYAYIETLAARQIAGGYACGSVNPQTGTTETCVAPNNRPYFRPGNYITRGQLVKLVVIAASQELGWDILNPVTPSFTDVPSGSTFYTYIETAVCHQVLGGYNDNTFRPNNFALRGQISKIVYNAVTGSASGCTNPTVTATATP